MFTHLLVPLDGSPLSEAALPPARELAARFGARVTLIHAVEKNPPGAVHGHPHLQDAREATEYLQAVARRAFAAGTRVDFHVHEGAVDDVPRSIVAHADELGHDLVVMCSHGRGKALHLLLGSIAQKVIALGSIPVLLIYPGEDDRPPTFSCRTILLPIDGDPDHAAALPVACELARKCAAILQLVFVVPSFATLSGGMMATGRMLPGTTARMLDLARQDAGEDARHLQRQLQEAGIEARAEVLQGDPAKTIVEAAERSGAGLLVLATHGRTGMQGFWEGSVAHHVAGRCRIPLFLLPLPAESDGRETPRT